MRTAFAAAAACALAAANAHAADITAASKIDAVVVFPSGAEVTRTANVKLDKGEHTLLFNDLPAGAIPGSIRVEGKATGKLDIGSVDTRTLLVPSTDSAVAETERRRIEDEIEAFRDQRSAFDAQAKAAETQRQLIANLAQLPMRPSPASGTESREDWAGVLGTIAAGSIEAQRLSQTALVKQREIDRQIEDLEKKLQSLAPAEQERTIVSVFVSADAPLEADMLVHYQISDASWSPLYDARLDSGGKAAAPKLTLTRRAEVTQNTGEEWTAIALTLSTTRPTAGSSAPELYTMTVDFEPEYKPRPYAAPVTSARDAAGAMAEAQPEADAALEAAAPPPEPAKLKRTAIGGRNANIVNAPFQALFAVPGRLSVPNTGEAKRVQLQEDIIPATLAVRTVPKIDAKAYLYAKLVLPKGSPMLGGPVSLFRDGTFVGTGSLPILSPGEDHELGFGIDDLVRVKHAVAEEKRGETGLITTSRTDSRNYKLTIKNMHERAVDLTVFDQVPVSANQDIKVELIGRTSPTKQDVEDKRGIVAWEAKLEPDQEQTIEFGYRVVWPSAKSIIYR